MPIPPNAEGGGISTLASFEGFSSSGNHDSREDVKIARTTKKKKKQATCNLIVLDIGVRTCNTTIVKRYTF